MNATATEHEDRRTPSRSLRSALRDMLGLVAMIAGVWLYHIYGRVLPTAAVIAVWLLLSLTIATGLFWRARIRRAAFLAAYVRRGAPLARWLGGGWLMVARQCLIAAALALALCVALIRLDDPRAWLVLVGSVPVIVLVHGLIERALARHANAVYLPELAWRATLAVVAAVMLGILVLLAFHRAYPALDSASLEQAAWHFADQERARSDIARILLQMAAAKDGLRLWLAQQLMPEPGTSLVQGAGWLIVLAEEALFVWSYLLLMSAIVLGLNRHDRIADRRD